MSPVRTVKLFTNGRSQAVRIPREFELPGDTALLRKEGERLIIEPAPPRSLLALLAELEPIDDDFSAIGRPRTRAGGAVTYKFLLDTNIISDLVRRPQGRVADAIAAEGEAKVATSIIVAAELRFGAAKSGSRKLARQLDTILSVLPILPFEIPAELRYAEVRARLERAGTPIGGNDLLIAAHALALDLVLVTANVREFKRVKGLRCVDWLR